MPPLPLNPKACTCPPLPLNPKAYVCPPPPPSPKAYVCPPLPLLFHTSDCSGVVTKFLNTSLDSCTHRRQGQPGQGLGSWGIQDTSIWGHPHPTMQLPAPITQAYQHMGAPTPYHATTRPITQAYQHMGAPTPHRAITRPYHAGIPVYGGTHTPPCNYPPALTG